MTAVTVRRWAPATTAGQTVRPPGQFISSYIQRRLPARLPVLHQDSILINLLAQPLLRIIMLWIKSAFICNFTHFSLSHSARFKSSPGNYGGDACVGAKTRRYFKLLSSVTGDRLGPVWNAPMVSLCVRPTIRLWHRRTDRGWPHRSEAIHLLLRWHHWVVASHHILGSIVAAAPHFIHRCTHLSIEACRCVCVGDIVKAWLPVYVK